MIENKRFYTTRHHHESGSYKMVHDKSERFSFPRATRDSDLFLHCMNTLAEENEELKEELTEQVNRKDACLKTTHSFNMKIKRLEKENEQLKKEVDEQDRRKWACLKKAHLLNLESEQLKLALMEVLQDNGNKYYIELFDELFNLNYDEWESKNEYPDWEKLLDKVKE